MTLDTWLQPANCPELGGPALLEALEELCERKQTLFLATPYLTFASRFLALEGQNLRIRASMSRNVAQHTLAGKDLNLRFSWWLTQYGGATRILSYDQDEAGKHLLVALPKVLVQSDLRRAWRCEQTGRSTGTLGGMEEAGMVFARFNLENISTTGLAVFAVDPLRSASFAPGRRVAVEFTLDHGPDLKGTATVCHANGQTLGLAFDPPLGSDDLAELTAWLAPRFEEAKRRWEARATFRAQAERASAPRPNPSGVLLVTTDTGLAGEVAEALAGAQDVRTVAPGLAPYREAMDQQPPFVVILACAGTLEECHRLRALAEKVPARCPVVVMNAGGPSGPVKDFAKDIHATLSTERAAQHPVFFRRLVVGLIRKHWSARV